MQKALRCVAASRGGPLLPVSPTGFDDLVGPAADRSGGDVVDAGRVGGGAGRGAAPQAQAQAQAPRSGQPECQRESIASRRRATRLRWRYSWAASALSSSTGANFAGHV